MPVMSGEPATCKGKDLPALPGEEQATAYTLARRRRRSSSARSGCGSIRMPSHPSCSRCQVWEASCGSLAPTSTKKPRAARPKNASLSSFSTWCENIAFMLTAMRDAFYFHSFKGQRTAMRSKSLSVESIVRSCRTQSCAKRASIVPICIPVRRQRFLKSAA